MANAEWMLTPKEIQKIGEKFCEEVSTNELRLNRGHWEIIAPRIAQAEAKKIIEWGEEYCDNPTHPAYSVGLFRIHCPECRQALRKEVLE